MSLPTVPVPACRHCRSPVVGTVDDPRFCADHQPIVLKVVTVATIRVPHNANVHDPQYQSIVAGHLGDWGNPYGLITVEETTDEWEAQDNKWLRPPTSVKIVDYAVVKGAVE